MNMPVLTLLVLIPFAGSILVLLLGRGRENLVRQVGQAQRGYRSCETSV